MIAMAGARRGTPRGAARGVALRAEAARRQTRASSRTTRPSATQGPVPKVYREMLAEAGVTTSQMTSDAPERPLKRPRTGRRPAEIAAEVPENPGPKPDDQEPAESSTARAASPPAVGKSEDEDEGDIDFEDVQIPEPTVQTTYLSSADESEEDEDVQFEDVDIGAIASKQEQTDESTGTLHLNLTAAQAALAPAKRNRKQPLTKEEKALRVEIHRMHLLCLLAHVEKRNHWCNDPVVHETLRPLLSAKTVQFLNPSPKLTQFGQAESLKKGLKEAEEVFQARFSVTEVGLRRAMWAENKADLQGYELPRNIDNCLDKADFRKAAQTLKGSRDVGAQLFCALLRAVGVEARLVCSLQPLSFVPGGPTMPKPRQDKTPPSRQPPTSASVETAQASPSPARLSARARLGHSNATAYHVPKVTASPSSRAQPPPRPSVKIHESPFPVYWTEVLDIGHQKWQPVDVLVTGQSFRPHRLEPPASDKSNLLTYVVAFEDDGAAKDVTRRYAKAYNSKTRRMRIDGPLVPSSVKGPRWWRKALRRYKPRGPPGDLDQIENTELNAAEAREPMPRNVADFKDHPIYALERHMRRHEVLVPGAQVVGTVGAGSKGPLERIYRRKDVHLAKSADKWYRLGREIKPGEEPMKVLPKRKVAKRKGRWHLDDASERSSDDEDPVLGIDPAKGNPIYTFDQTELYSPPPVVAGRVPKNRFGNIDAYVPSMVPPGGVHIRHPRAGYAAHILGVDYAPALQGFEFKGRKGTAVYNGVIIPVEATEGVRAVLKGFEDLEAQLEEERRSLRALETWRKWLRTLRIRRRIFEKDEFWGDTELGEFELPPESDEDDEEPRGHGVVGGMVIDDDEGGGFEPEPGGFEPVGNESDGFEPAPGGFEAGGSLPGGYEPGGFEPGGFEAEAPEPGGFDAGGFEPGGFEVDGTGKGIEPEPTIFDHDEEKPDEVQPGGLKGADEASAQGSGGFEVVGDADIDMVDQPSQSVDSPPAAGEPAAVEGPDLASPAPETEMDANSPQHLQPDESLTAEPRSAEASGEQGQSEDSELDDAPSDVTEELFMDEDGSLLE